ncbi:MAG: SCO5389 family protein [Streptomycetales bacterium]
MSLNVSTALMHRAQRDTVTDQDFITCIRESLPYAWQVISNLVSRTDETGSSFAQDQAPPPSDEAQGQLLRAMASDAMREALQRHFGVRIAFQNCHGVGVFTPAADESVYRDFVSARRQLLNQSPELINC